MLQKEIGHSSSQNQPHVHANLHVNLPIQVSVIVPTYNNGRFILQALDSIFTQSFKAFEVIVVDDGSTDDTQSVLLPVQEKIRYVYQENSGSAVARNTGLSLASGEYIVFLDADDLLLPGKLQEQCDFLNNNPKVGMVHSGWYLINETGEQIGEVSPWLNAPELTLEAWMWKKPIKMGAMMYRRVWLRHINGFDPELRQSQDTDLMLRLALAGCTAEWIKKPTMCYRKYATSTIRRNAPAQYHYLLKVQEKAFDHPNMPAKLKAKRSRMRYFSLRWVVWHIFSTGFPDAVIEPLKDAAEHSPYDDFDTVFDWVFYLAEHLVSAKRPLSDLNALKPHINSVISIPAAQWQMIERFLRLIFVEGDTTQKIESPHYTWGFWKTAVYEAEQRGVSAEQLYLFLQTVWLPYFSKEQHPLPATSPPFDDGGFASVGRLCIVQRDYPYPLEMITQFWQDAVAVGWVSKSYRRGLVSWQLTLFGQLALRRRWREAFTAVFKAAQNSLVAPSAFGAWWQFAQTAFHYFQTQIKN